jgi:hypothetical protein
MNRLVIQVPEGTRELLLCDATPSWGRTTNKMRQARADELRNQMS